jgi:hypothetical protein
MAKREHNFGNQVGFTEHDVRYLTSRGVPEGDAEYLMEVADSLSELTHRKKRAPNGWMYDSPMLARVTRHQVWRLYVAVRGDMEDAEALVELARTMRSEVEGPWLSVPHRALNMALQAYAAQGPRVLRY